MVVCARKSVLLSCLTVCVLAREVVALIHMNALQLGVDTTFVACGGVQGQAVLVQIGHLAPALTRVLRHVARFRNCGWHEVIGLRPLRNDGLAATLWHSTQFGGRLMYLSLTVTGL